MEFDLFKYSLSISKAINQHESPVKEKHVRSAIIGTFQEKGAQTFWTCVLRLPLQDHLIVCWKFCHVLHKVLREGHPQVIPNSQQYKKKIEDFGKLWGYLKEGYGKLIQHYCTLLITKLEFHRKNPRFPGNLMVTKEELENIGENDINIYFQMSVEMFDYMDDILELQGAIFGSLDMSRANSMTSSGQCRLAPLIPCIQDSSQLYDYCVKILFKLHASLPADTLSGHRDRFNKQFRKLRQFYLNASTLQYFRNLIQVPLLPENPPNFLVQSDLREYVTPVVILPPETPTPENDGVDGSLIDTSDAGSVSGDLVDLTHRNGSSSPDLIAERDHLIDQLQQEITRLRMENQRLMMERMEHNRIVEIMRERILELETQLAKKEHELLQEKKLKEELLLQTEAISKQQETEQKAKTLEEKFQKLKDVYQKLREEHIQLLRQKAGLEKQLKMSDKITTFAKAANNLIMSIKADVDKQIVSAKTISEEAERSKAAVEAKLQEMLVQKSVAEETLQKAASEKDVEIIALKSVQQQFEDEKKNFLCEIDRVLHEKSRVERELEELKAMKDDLDVRLKSEELKTKEEKEKFHQDAEDTMYNILVSCISQAEVIVQHAIHEIDNPALSAVTCTPDYFLGLTDPVLQSLSEVDNSFQSFCTSSSSLEDLIRRLSHMSHILASYLIQGKTTSNTSPDIEFGEHIAEVCKSVGRESLVLLMNMKQRDKAGEVSGSIVVVKGKIEEVTQLVNRLTSALKGDSLEQIGDMVESELTSMDKAIEEAAARIEEMLNKSRAADSGIKLEVNEKILDSCTTLMQAIRVLVQKSKLLQAEIVAQGKGTASATEFYKRNHRWTEGLISAAKAVGMGAKFLVNAADKVVSGQGKFEHLVVASQEIAGSTAQLVVASRVKAHRSSPNLSALSTASRGVTQATGGVVATAKSCSQMVEESEELDVSGLSLHQAKKQEMESQVRVLELESSLQQERERLSALRRHHYQLAGEIEGWEEKDMA